MSDFKLSKRSVRRMEGVHPNLRLIVRRAIEITTVDFGISEGRRSISRQQALVDSGASWTMKSYHLTGHAIDLFAWLKGEVRWDWMLYHQIAFAMKQAAEAEGVAIKWGGDWKRTPDGPHFQLARRLPFPNEAMNTRNKNILERLG